MKVLCSKKTISIFLSLTLIMLSSASMANSLRKVRFGVSYIPNVQFAPIYVAQVKGFYAEEGLKVEVEYGYENDFVALAAQGSREFALASGDQIILARSQGMPIKYIMKWHQKYPVALMAPKSRNIQKVSDLPGKSVGIPGFFGASYIGWKALVFTSGIDEKEVDVKQIGFTQASALQQGLVDSAIVYIVNEPIQLRNAGVEVDVIEVSDFIDLVSNGMVAGDKLLKKEPELVEKMVRATQKGLQFAIKNQEETFAISRKIIPEITDKDAPVQMQVLTESAKLWKSKTMGASDRAAWVESVEFMKKTGLLTKKVNVDDLFTNEFIQR